MKLHTLKSGLPTLRPRLCEQRVKVERLRGRAAMDRRQRIMVRDRCTCGECGRTTLDGQADHIIPLHMNGPDTDANMRWLCTECHKAKTAAEAGARVGLTAA